MSRYELVLIAIHGTVKTFAVHDPLSDTNMMRSINIGVEGFTRTKQ
jgi:hypothetical protein